MNLPGLVELGGPFARCGVGRWAFPVAALTIGSPSLCLPASRHASDIRVHSHAYDRSAGMPQAPFSQLRFPDRVRAPSLEQIPVQRAVLDRFEDVVRGDRGGAFEVGEGAGDLEDAVVGAAREVEGFHGLFEIG